MSGSASRESLERGSSTAAPIDAAPTRDAPYSRDFWLLFAASFAFNLTANLFVMFPLFVVRLGGSAATIGAVVGTGSLGALLVRPAVGAGIDTMGRKWIALRFLVLDAVAIMLYSMVDSLSWPIYAVRALHGALDGTARVALFVFVYEILPPGRQGEAMSTFSLCGMVPAAIGPMAGEELIKRYGFRGFFAAGCVLCLAAAAMALMLPDDPPRRDGGEERAGPATSYGALLADRGLKPLWIVTVLFALAISSRLSFVAPFAYQRGIQRVGWYFAIYSAAAVVLRLFGARATDRIGLERMLLPSLATLGIGLAILALTGRTGMLDLAALVGGMGHGYVYPSLSALVIGRTQSRAAGRSSSIYGSLYDFGAMAGPYALGAMASAAGYGPMFIVAGGLLFAAAGYFVAVEPAALSRRLG